MRIGGLVVIYFHDSYFGDNNSSTCHFTILPPCEGEGTCLPTRYHVSSEFGVSPSETLRERSYDFFNERIRA